MEKDMIEKILNDLKNELILRIYSNEGLDVVKKTIREGNAKSNRMAPSDTLSRNIIWGLSVEIGAISTFLDNDEIMDNTTNYSEFTAWLREIADELDKLSSSSVGQA